MRRLVYTVEVDDIDDEAEQYLSKLAEVFRGITEGLSAWGYTADQLACSSKVENEYTHIK